MSNKLVIQVAQMFIGLGLLIWAFYPRTVPATVTRNQILACDMKMRHQECVADISGEHVHAQASDNRRIVAIGDVHGAYSGMLESLYDAKIITATDSCEWTNQTSEGVILVQQGDLVDRGPQAFEALECLRHLQREAYKYNSKVVRIIGNHEMWWLNGYFHDRHPEFDTRERIISTLRALVADITDGSLQAAYVHTRYEVPLLFIHAGVRPKYYEHLRKALRRPNDATPLTAVELADAVNGVLKKFVADCDGTFPCKQPRNEFFEAGPDRGGAGIGGPLWTDFSVLVKADEQGTAPASFIQVVGHTMAYCYSPNAIGVHPPPTQAECALGLVRASPHMQAICVDGGMWVGGRAYMEIGTDAHFRAYQRYRGVPSDPHYNEYQVTDLTQRVCGSDGGAGVL